MKNLILATLVAFFMSACATGGGPTGDLGPMVGVMKLTESLVKDDVEKAATVRAIASDIRKAATNEEFETVGLFIQAARAKVPWERMTLADIAIAEELLKLLRQRLVDELGEDILPEHLRLSVEKVSGWVILAAVP